MFGGFGFGLISVAVGWVGALPVRKSRVVGMLSVRFYIASTYCIALAVVVVVVAA